MESNLLQCLQCNSTLENYPDDDNGEVKLVNFGCIPVDKVVEKTISIENTTEVREFHLVVCRLVEVAYCSFYLPPWEKGVSLCMYVGWASSKYPWDKFAFGYLPG